MAMTIAMHGKLNAWQCKRLVYNWRRRERRGRAAGLCVRLKVTKLAGERVVTENRVIRAKSSRCEGRRRQERKQQEDNDR